MNVNQPTPGVSNDADPVTFQERRPYYSKFPYFSDILQYSNVGYSNYDGLQVNLVDRNSHGLTLAVAYTLARAMTTQSGESDNFPFLRDSTNVSSSYAPMNSTPRHHLGITVTYAIPGKKGYGQMLEGWSVNSAFNFLSGVGVDQMILSTTSRVAATWAVVFTGSYWNLYGHANDFSKTLGAYDTDSLFCGASSIFANAFGCSTDVPQACISAAASEPTNSSVPGSSGAASLAQYGCYAEGNSVIVPPAQGTLGNMYRNEITGRGLPRMEFFSIQGVEVLGAPDYPIPGGVFQLYQQPQLRCGHRGVHRRAVPGEYLWYVHGAGDRRQCRQWDRGRAQNPVGAEADFLGCGKCGVRPEVPRKPAASGTRAGNHRSTSQRDD